MRMDVAYYAQKHCLDEVAYRGPKDDDCAVVNKSNASNDEVVSAMADLLGDDADGLQSMLEDFNL